MFIGRKDELRQMESVFATEHSNLIVLYGREGIGKTSLSLAFAEKKQFMYYKAVEVSEAEQDRRIEGLIRQICESPKSDTKKLVIIDEFHFITSLKLVDSLLKLVSDEEKYGKYMVLLLSSSVNWVENRMVPEHKELARFITGIIRVKELSFAETVEWFPKASVEDCIVMHALLGGVPKYMIHWQENRRVRENMIALFFSENSLFLNEAEYQLKLELRELGSYNTILTALASGRYKLNDIYAYTGYSRAKISVYLKNLTEMGLVEKIFSVNVKKSENTKKGLYRICDNFLNFYYAYVFPNISDIEAGKGRQVYNDRVMPDFDRIMRGCFADVCREYLELMSRYKKLGYRYSEWRSWYGKQGTIDIIGQDTERHMIAGICKYDDQKTGIESIEELRQLIADAGIKPQKLCIFSKAGFTPEAVREARETGIMVIPMSEL